MIFQYAEAMTRAHILVVGDIMLDRYWLGDTDRVSPEAPVPVVKMNDDEFRPGGAANVALNIVALGGKATLLAHTGQDELADDLHRYLDDRGVQCYFHQHENFRTASKVRILSQGQQLIRLDFERELTSQQAEAIMSQYEQLLTGVDAIICSDYGKGSMKVIGELIKQAKKQEIPVFVDPKSSDFSVYAGAELITPNLKEFEAVVGPCQDTAEITAKATALIEAHGLSGLLVTRGKDGMSLIQKSAEPFHLATQAKEVFDVTGAGDTVIAAMALACGAKVPAHDCARLANMAAGVVVGKVGTATASLAEVCAQDVQQLLKNKGAISLENAVQLRQALKEQGKTLVMTNGCFDLLHPGHLQYLYEAKALGDYLMIAVNTDESVQQLKGPTRPINALESRMTMLSALDMVDWVVAFSDETPKVLYDHLLPDVLVKGGDYQPKEVAGYEAVTANGGEVKILSFLPGYSSSAVIEKIRRSDDNASIDVQQVKENVEEVL